MIRYVKKGDESQILSMMELVKDDFAGYKEKKFLEAIYNAIDKEEAIVEEEEGRITGLLICSKKEKELSFLAVHPQYRKRGVAKKLIKKCWNGLLLEISSRWLHSRTVIRRGFLQGHAITPPNL